MTRLGVLGGTFDPIHLGHLAAAAAAEGALHLDALTLVPAHVPPHRSDPVRAGVEHRLAMAALAVQGRPGWTVSDTEVRRDGPSYTFDTLAGLGAAGHAASQIFFIIGADAFAEIATWSRYPGVLDLAHFAVVARPGITLHSLQTRLPDLADRMTTPDLVPRSAFGHPPSGTRVILIHTETPDISSTEIRRRVAAGESIRGLVPEAVAAYIARHRLYGGPGL